MRIREDLLDLCSPFADYLKSRSFEGGYSTGLLQDASNLRSTRKIHARFSTHPLFAGFARHFNVSYRMCWAKVPSDRYLQDEVAAEFHATETRSSKPSQCDLDEEEPPKEIPWPMFHPIPTRPVFGGSGR